MTKLTVLVIFLLILTAGLLQNTDILMVAGVKPNLLLVIMVALAFFVEDAWIYGFFILEAAALLAVGGFFAPEIIVFALLAITAAWIAARWHTQAILTAALVVSSFTVIFYAFSEPSYLLSSPGRISIELIYNLVLGVIFFNVFTQCLKTSSMLKT